ncbi:MAG: GH92 family glycosyl hydrolase [Bacteroides sp.]|nr:GH92 family glycosyl hydrolase [Bacteroides sp.]MCM1477553.1 GH92 family glycosyl hydrolase [Bacteroides sp.]
MKLTSATLSMVTVVAMAFSCSTGKKSAADDYASKVNPFIGTDFTGNTYPGAQAPFGMVQLSPDNGLPGWDRIAGYFYPDSTIAGFSHTHLNGTGAGDLYDISFMPVTLPYKEAPAPLGIHSKFSHDTEEAEAGYYKVTLDDYGIDVELTATERTGIQRYTFPGGEAAVILNLAKAMNWDATVDTKITIVDSVTVEGYRFSNGWARDQRVYFRSRFSKPWKSVSIDTTAIVDADTNKPTGGIGSVATFNFNTTKGEQITVSTAISGVSVEGAAANLAAEAPTDDFDKYRQATRDNWNAQLGKIEVTGDSINDVVNFYTALYHSMNAPTIFSDVDGKYRGPDGKIHQADGWTNYSSFSLWDTFRAAHPLLTYTEPERTNDMIKSFLAFYDQNGRLPVWNFQGVETDMMLGYHAVPVIVDAYMKGIGDFDAEKALAACVATANMDEYRGIGLFKKLGYVPYDVTDSYNSENWSLSRTLEYAYDDYCIALMAEKMGKKDIADEFYARSKNYRNTYNPAYGFMVPRDSNGNWQPNFSPDEYTPHISESNGWQYLWSVQHDIPGLIELMGRDRFEQKLDSMFTYMPADKASLPIFSTGMIGQYAHGNEPSHHVIYLFNKIGQPWKAAEYAAKVMHELYFNAPAGLCGNEDMGQMSAWYVMSAMGFYPVNPVSGQYEIGTPLFKETKMHLANGKTFTVKAPEVSRENIYIKGVKVNGKPYHESYLTHDMIMEGATVEFEMTNEPGHVWFGENQK